MSERDVPCAIALTVPIEHGQITMPRLSADPDAGGAPRSLSSYMVIAASHASAPIAERSSATERYSVSLWSNRTP